MRINNEQVNAAASWWAENLLLAKRRESSFDTTHLMWLRNSDKAIREKFKSKLIDELQKIFFNPNSAFEFFQLTARSNIAMSPALIKAAEAASLSWFNIPDVTMTLENGKVIINEGLRNSKDEIIFECKNQLAFA